MLAKSKFNNIEILISQALMKNLLQFSKKKIDMRK